MIEFVNTLEACIGGMDRVGIAREYPSYKSIGQHEYELPILRHFYLIDTIWSAEIHFRFKICAAKTT